MSIDREEWNVAKIRHRVFEVYQLRDEAISVLTPKSAHAMTKATMPESSTFKHLTVSCSASVTLVQFKEENYGEETVSDLRGDFTQLADRLVIDSKVLLDFTGVKSFCAASIDALTLFSQKLRSKGSRIALCCFSPEVQASFFDRSNGDGK